MSVLSKKCTEKSEKSENSQISHFSHANFCLSVQLVKLVNFAMQIFVCSFRRIVSDISIILHTVRSKL